MQLHSVLLAGLLATSSVALPSPSQQSTGRDAFAMCAVAKNCEVCTTNGKKDVCFKKGYEPGTEKGDAMIKGTGQTTGSSTGTGTATAKSGKKTSTAKSGKGSKTSGKHTGTGTATTATGTGTGTAKSGKGSKTSTKKGKHSSTTTTGKTTTQTGNAADKRDALPVERNIFESRDQGDDAPKGYHFETQFKIGDSSLVYGCAEKGAVDPGQLIGDLIKQQCGSTGPCNPDNGEGTKIFWVAPSTDGDTSWQWMASEAMTVKTDGDYYNSDERDGFVGAIQAYANKLNTRKMQKFGTPDLGGGGGTKVRRDNETMEPTMVRREDDSSAAKPHPSDIPWGPAETSTCELVKAAASYAFDRWKVSDTNKDDATLVTRFRTDVTVKSPSADWCSTLTTAFGALAGIIPEFGGAISAVIGVASTACDA